MERFAGTTAIETSVGATTVTPVDPLTEPEVAAIVVLPLVMAVASPELALIVATAIVDELHTGEATACVLPSLKWPVAVNCEVPPLGRLEFAGVTVMDWSTAPPYPPLPPQPVRNAKKTNAKKTPKNVTPGRRTFAITHAISASSS
jgi:hypothetical protein